MVSPGVSTEEPFTQELTGLFRELRMRGWVLILWGPKSSPDLYAATFRHPAHADVLLLRASDSATAYRAPAVGDSSVFNPGRVVYQYHSSAVWALRAILTLPAPGHPYAPMILEEPTQQCFLPDGLSQPVITRPLSQSR